MQGLVRYGSRNPAPVTHEEGVAAHIPQRAALSPEIRRTLGSEPVAAPARMLLASASAEPFGKSLAWERSFQDHASPHCHLLVISCKRFKIVLLTVPSDNFQRLHLT